MAPKIVHLVRHAQGFHNLSYANHSIPDPLLTEYGQQQCRELSEAFPDTSALDLIVASPLKRTIYTALLSFPSVIAEKQLKVVALPEIQETSDLPCDTGSEPSELAREFDGKPVDLHLVQEGWNSKKGKWASYDDAIDARAREARQWLMSRDEEEIAVVTHGGYLHYFTQDWADHSKFVGTGWANTEFRSYTFDANSVDDARLIETKESRVKRLGDEKPLDAEEQTNLRRVMLQTSLEKGFLKGNTGLQQIESKI